MTILLGRIVPALSSVACKWAARRCNGLLISLSVGGWGSDRKEGKERTCPYILVKRQINKFTIGIGLLCA
eukprot:9169416-Pyramimonas_sp.AAC.1